MWVLLHATIMHPGRVKLSYKETAGQNANSVIPSVRTVLPHPAFRAADTRPPRDGQCRPLARRCRHEHARGSHPEPFCMTTGVPGDGPFYLS